mgnify:CR=1 FL=1
MLDIRLYKSTADYDVVDLISEEMTRAYPDDPTARSIEVIGGKVVKFLLTRKGTDAFNPDYGGTALHNNQISESYLPQIALELNIDVENCYNFIKATELSADVVGEKLLRIDIDDIAYDPDVDPTRIDVYLTIYTTYGKHAVVAITNKTED